MTILPPVTGGAIPQGWRVEDAARDAQERIARNRFFLPRSIPGGGGLLADVDPFDRTVNVAQTENGDLIASGDWPVRNQAHRGTCNAFATVAAEELYNWHRNGNLVNFSEEYLYAATRQQPLVGLTVDAAKFEKDGATFLQQVRNALRDAPISIVPAGNPPYDTDPDRKRNFTIEINPNAPAVTTRGWSYTHDIFDRPVVSENSKWRHDVLNGKRVSDTFLDQLHNGIPVIASFAVLGGPAAGVWNNAKTRRSGIVSYPKYSNLKESERNPTGGHTVCLTGYLPGNTIGDDGWFVFRNSYGADIFGRDVADAVGRIAPPARGYGIISASDVEFYCWEFLYRA